MGSPSSPDDPVAPLRALARAMDSAVQVPGTSIRFGADALLGLVPVVGDLAGAVLSGYVVLAAVRLGARPPVVARMVLNVAVDALVGAVPLVGDLFDIGWRANTRNVALLERALAAPASAERRSVALLAGVVVALGVVSAATLAGSVWLVRWLGAHL